MDTENHGMEPPSRACVFLAELSPPPPHPPQLSRRIKTSIVFMIFSFRSHGAFETVVLFVVVKLMPPTKVDVSEF